jgi:hypothetical protein
VSGHEPPGTRTKGVPQVPVPEEADVMREQLEYLIQHVTEKGICGCSECQRFLRVRSELLEIFTSGPAPHQIRPLTTKFPTAA